MSDLIVALEANLKVRKESDPDICIITAELLQMAIAEIYHLRASVTILRRMAGPVAIDRSFVEIKQEIKSGSA